MKPSLFLPLTLILLLLPRCVAQDFGVDVDELKLVEISPTTVRLSWKPAAIGDCEKATYSVFRGDSEDFTPSIANRIASRITKNSYLVKESASQNYYYVKELPIPAQCALGSAETTNSSVASEPTQSSNQSSAKFPTEGQISVLLTQSERALEIYEHAVTMEQSVLPKQGGDADTQVAAKLRHTVAQLKNAPHLFNSPYGFILISDLDDASRNMAICMGQGWGLALSSSSEAELATAQQKMLLAQTCQDTSTLLYTVSETAVEMYGNYLLADNQLRQRETDALNRCAEVLKNASSKQSKIPSFSEWQKQQQAKQGK